MSTMAVVYSNDCPASWKKVAADSVTVWQCDNTADEVQINAAIASVAATGQNASSAPNGGGGSVILLGNTFTISSPIIIRSWVELSGAAGQAGTHINAASNISGVGMITTQYTYTERTYVHDLMLAGRDYGSNVAGMYYESQTTQTPFTYSDPKHRIENMWIYRNTGAGISMNSSCRGSIISHCHIGQANGWGIDGPGLVDSCVSNCHLQGNGTAGTSGGVNAGNVNVTWENMRVYNSHGTGIRIDAVRQAFNGCHSIDSSYDNWYINAGKVVLSGCTSDSAALSAGGYDGFRLHYFNNGVMRGCQSWDRNVSPANHQRYGIYCDSSYTYCRIECSTYNNVTGSFGGNTTPGTGSVYDVYGD